MTKQMQASFAGTAMQGTTVSVVIPCRNEREHIIPLLDSIYVQKRDGFEMEVLVADGMSDDGTRELLERYRQTHSSVSVIDNPARIVSTGLNAAIRQSTGNVIVRMDVHTTYTQDYIRQCLKTLDETGADNVGGPWVAHGEGLIGRAIAAAFQSRWCMGGARGHNPEYLGEVDTVYLGCWRREIFDRIGYFDPNLVRNQDDELNLRLIRAGGKVWQSPTIKSSYSCRGSLSALFRQYAQYGFWKVKVIRKHGAPASWRHFVPGTFVLATFLLPVVYLLARFASLGGVARASGTAWISMLTIYAIASLSSAVVHVRSEGWRIALCLPVIFGIYHFSYGIGFLSGVFSSFPTGAMTRPSERFFDRLTR